MLMYICVSGILLFILKSCCGLHVVCMCLLLGFVPPHSLRAGGTDGDGCAALSLCLLSAGTADGYVALRYGGHGCAPGDSGGCQCRDGLPSKPSLGP